MSPPIRRKYHDSVAFATGCWRINKSRRCNRKIRVLIAMWPCRVEEKMTLKEVDGQTIQEFETKIIAKDDTITRVPGTFQDYKTSEEDSMERPRRRDLYGFVDHPQLQQRKNEEEVERDEVDSDLESTASSKPVWEKTTEDDHDRASRGSTTVKGGIYNYGGQHNYTCATTQVDLQKMAPNRRSGPSSSNDNENPDIAAIIAQQLQTILPEIITQVTNNVNNVNNANNGNGGNGGNNGCTFKAFQSCNPKEYDGKGGAIVLTRWIEKMENVIDNSGCAENQKVRYAASSLVNKALTWWNTQVQARGRVAAMAMAWNDFKALMVEEFCPSNEMEKLENEFWNHEGGGLNHLDWLLRLEGNAILRAGILTDEAVSCDTLTKGGDKRKGMEESSKTGGSWKDNKKAKTGTGFDHFRNTCPKLNRVPGQVGNQLALEGNRNNRSNGNQVRGRAFNVNVNAMEAVQDPKVVTGTFSLNDQFVTILFDSGADFSFISTEFAPLLNVDLVFVTLLELGGSMFSINLIRLGHGSFDVIVGNEIWLFPQHKAVIVCHEKVVEIPVEDGRVLRVHGERAIGITKALRVKRRMNPEDCLSATNSWSFARSSFWRDAQIAKLSEYRLVPSEMQELFGQLQSCSTRVSYVPSHSPWERQKERLKPRRVRAMVVTVQAGMRKKIQVAQSEALKQENALMENLHGLEQQMEKKEGESLYLWTQLWVPDLAGDMYWWPGMKRDIATYVNKRSSKGYADNRRNTIGIRSSEIKDVEKYSPWNGRNSFWEKKGQIRDKIDKTLRFVGEHVEIDDREFTWEHEDYMKSKYPLLFVVRADEIGSLNLEKEISK
ncbi:putative reverse transcriptase domain-containing protein [Tanacetum coccineum]